MTLALTEDETASLVAHLRRAIEYDPFPYAPRLDPLKATLAKLEPGAATRTAATVETGHGAQPWAGAPGDGEGLHRAASCVCVNDEAGRTKSFRRVYTSGQRDERYLVLYAFLFNPGRRMTNIDAATVWVAIAIVSLAILCNITQ
jgi:hypothetical protein